jgi:hypothetical protein
MWSSNFSIWNDVRNQAAMRAYAKFRDKAYETAEMGLFIAERKEAINLVTGRLSQLELGMEHLLNGRFQSFLRTYNVKPKRKHRKVKWNRPQQAASLWLEYWLGWAPMIADIFAAIDVLQSDYPKDLKVVETSVIRDSRKGSWGVWSNPGFDAGDFDLAAIARVKYQAVMSVTNPALFRANQLGLINPVGIAFELIPLSFILNWFVNVQDFIGSFTDWVGLNLTDAFTVSTLSVKGSETWRPEWTPAISEFSVDHQLMSRSMGIIAPNLGIRHFPGLSMSRAATSISLIVSFFSPRR